MLSFALTERLASILYLALAVLSLHPTHLFDDKERQELMKTLKPLFCKTE